MLKGCEMRRSGWRQDRNFGSWTSFSPQNRTEQKSINQSSTTKISKSENSNKMQDNLSMSTTSLNNLAPSASSSKSSKKKVKVV